MIGPMEFSSLQALCERAAPALADGATKGVIVLGLAWALAVVLRSSAYAGHVLEIARRMRAGLLASSAAITMARRSQLEGRLLAILDSSRKRRMVTREAVSFSILVVLPLVAALSALRLGASDAPDAPEARAGGLQSRPEAAVFKAKRVKSEAVSPSDARILLSAYAVDDAVILTVGGAWHNSPALADLDGDGDLEVVSSTGGWVGAWHHDGKPVAGWPQRAAGASPAVGDVDGDGKPEVAAPGHLWRDDGTEMAGWPTGRRANEFCTPGLDDVDGDGKLEILSTDFELGVCVRRFDGTMLAGWPVAVEGNDVRCTPMAHDLDGDGAKEIVFIDGPKQEIRVHRLDGSLTKTFHLPGAWVMADPFVLADMNGDGRVDLVAGRGAIAVDLTNGSTISLGGGAVGNAPCLVREKGSPRPIPFSAALPPNAPATPQDVSRQPGSYSDSAIVADIDGDGKLETLFGNREGGFHACRSDGSQPAGWPKRLAPSGDCALAVGDLDGDGRLNVVANTSGGKVYVFDCPGAADGQAPWPLFLANNRRTGVPEESGAPRARRMPITIPPLAWALEGAMAMGEWDSAIGLFREAMAAIGKADDIDSTETRALRQNGLLSIARILNTRARRFDEAAEAYRQAVEIAPHSWQACQALTECSDLAVLHPEAPKARSELDAAAMACLEGLDATRFPELNLFKLTLAKTCLLVERQAEATALLDALTGPSQPPVGFGPKPATWPAPTGQVAANGQTVATPAAPAPRPTAQGLTTWSQEAKALLQALAPGRPTPSTQRVDRVAAAPRPTAAPQPNLENPYAPEPWPPPRDYYGVLANRYKPYEGFPFLLTVEEQHSVELRTRSRDIDPSGSLQAKAVYRLEISPHNPSEEPFPVILNLAAAEAPATPDEEGWTVDAGGRRRKTLQKDIQSDQIGASRAERIQLCSRTEEAQPVTIRRDVEKIDDRRYRVKVFVQSPLKDTGLIIYRPKRVKGIEATSALPAHGATVRHPSELSYWDRGKCRCGCGKDVSEYWTFAAGATFEFVMEPAAGVQPALPQVTLIAADRSGESSARMEIGKVAGTFGGIDYELTSPRRFKPTSARSSRFWEYVLEELPWDGSNVRTPPRLGNAANPREAANTIPQPFAPQENAPSTATLAVRVLWADTSEPVSGATLSFSSGWLLDKRRPVDRMTDARGVATFDQIQPDWRYMSIVVFHPDSAAFSKSVPLPTVGQMEFRLERGGSVFGAVWQEGRKAPAAFARVFLLSDNGNVWGQARADGSFEFGRLKDGKASLLAVQGDCVSARDADEMSSFDLARGQRLGPVDLVLQRASTLVGRIVDGDTGASIPNATVRVSLRTATFSLPWPVEPKANEAGAYQLSGLPRGPYSLTARADNYSQATAELTLAGDAATRHDFALRRGASVFGHVRFASDGRAAAGAMIWVGAPSQGYGHARSGEDGAYELKTGNLKGQARVSAILGSFRSHLDPDDGEPVDLTTGRRVGPCDLLLKPGLALAGTVRDRQTAAPIAGATVRAPMWDSRGADVVRNPQIVSGADGSYRVEGLPSGQVDVAVFANGFATMAVSIPMDPTTGATHDFELGPGGEVDVLVVDEQGTPVRGVELEAHCSPPLLEDFLRTLWRGSSSGLHGDGHVLITGVSLADPPSVSASKKGYGAAEEVKPRFAPGERRTRATLALKKED